MTRLLFRRIFGCETAAGSRQSVCASPHKKPHWAGFLHLRQRLQSAILITFATFAWSENDFNPKDWNAAVRRETQVD
jgi:hypothetical protein